jgi:hypothetical protein
LDTTLPVLTEKSDHKKSVHIREIAHSNVGTGSDQATKHCIMTAGSGTEQRRVDAIVHGMDVSTFANQVARHIEVAPQGSPVKGRHAE